MSLVNVPSDARSNPSNLLNWGRPGRFAGAAALLFGSVAFAIAVLRITEGVFEREPPWFRAGFLVVVAMVALACAIRTRRRLEPVLLGAALCSTALCIGGLPELPPYVSVASFGRSEDLLFVVAALLFGGLAFAPASRTRAPADVGLLLLVVFSAFGGPLYVRAGDDFYTLFALLNATVLVCLPGHPNARFGNVPYLRLYALFLVATAVPMSAAVDADRHLQAWIRIALSSMPLLVMGLGAVETTRVASMLRAFAWTAAAGAACGLVVLAEAARHVGFGLVLRSRLTLFGEHPNIIAPFFAVAPPLLLALIPWARGRIARIAILLVTAACLFMLVRTESRAAIAAAAAGLAASAGILVVVWLWRKRPTRSFGLTLVGAGIVVAGATAFLARNVVGEKFDNPSMQFRRYLWNVAVESIEERPTSGYGMLSSAPLMMNARSSALDGRPKDTHPHSLLLAIAMGAGLPAAVVFLLLVVSLLIRTGRAACFLADGKDRALAVGVFGSSVAMSSANIIDQGLALNTPIPLHLGLLFGASAVLVRKATLQVHADTPVLGVVSGAAGGRSGRSGRICRIIAMATALTLFLVVAVTAAAERLVVRANAQLRQKDRRGALTTMALARRLNPWSLQIGVRHAQILDASGDRAGAIEALKAVAFDHPMSYLPWERLSVLHYDRRDWIESLSALMNAMRRDPTGPLINEWFLRAGKLNLLIHQRDRGRDYLAKAFERDYTAPRRLSWLFGDEQAYLPGPRGTPRLTINEILEQNRVRIAPLIDVDPIRARQMAVTLARIYVQFRRPADAVAILDEYERLSGSEWSYLQSIRKELGDRAEGRAAEVVDATAAAGAHLVEARKLVDEDRAAEAATIAAAGFARVFDAAEEREYAGLLVTIVFEHACEISDLATAEQWFAPQLYYAVLAADRARVRAAMSKVLREHGRDDDALDVLEPVATLIRSMRADQNTAETCGLIADELAALSASEGSRAQDFLDSIPHCAPGLLLRSQVYRRLGRPTDAAVALRELRQAFPEWHYQLSQ